MRRGGEFTVVLLMALGFSLVGIDRFLISTLFPVIAHDLHLGYRDIGLITGALAFAWGLSALLMGNWSDRIGRRIVLTGALVVFSLLIGASGLASGLAGLIAVRLAMGLADGAFAPASIAETLAASAPGRHGFNIGLQQTAMPLFGLALAPLLVVPLLHVMSWRAIFSLFTLPGLLLSWAVWRQVPARVAPPAGRRAVDDWRAVIGVWNVRICMGMMLCWLTCLVTTSALLPNYLLDHLHLGFAAMSQVMSAIGLGAATGTLILPALSDRLGRKRVMVLATSGLCVSLWVLMRTGAEPAPLFAALFAVHAFNNALITLTVGPVCAEAVPPTLTATASGLVIAVGELFGGGIAPVLGGHVAEIYGIQHVLWLPLAASVAGLALCCALRGSACGPIAAPVQGSAS